MASTLPLATVEPAANEGWLKVTCPRRTAGCGETFYARDEAFREGRGPNRATTMGRACPYCFATMRLAQAGDQETLV